VTVAPLLALLASAAAADPAQSADARASAATAAADSRATSAGISDPAPVPVPPAPGGDWAERTARLEQPRPAEPERRWYSLYDGRRFGLQLDLGAPDVSGLSLVFRPWRALRVEAGGNFDVVSGGLHAGLTVLPFHWGVVPTAHVEVGHLFDGDVSGYAGSGTSAATRLVLKQVGYDYANAQLGIELGSQDRFVFFVRGGVFWLWTEAKNFQQAANLNNSGASFVAANPSIKLRGPSVNLGFLLYLF
jgi:hypothetical protein